MWNNNFNLQHEKVLASKTDDLGVISLVEESSSNWPRLKIMGNLTPTDQPLLMELVHKYHPKSLLLPLKLCSKITDLCHLLSGNHLIYSYYSNDHEELLQVDTTLLWQTEQLDIFLSTPDLTSLEEFLAKTCKSLGKLSHPFTVNLLLEHQHNKDFSKRLFLLRSLLSELYEVYIYHKYFSVTLSIGTSEALTPESLESFRQQIIANIPLLVIDIHGETQLSSDFILLDEATLNPNPDLKFLRYPIDSHHTLMVNPTPNQNHKHIVFLPQ